MTDDMVRVAGFEPAASSVQDWRYTTYVHPDKRIDDIPPTLYRFYLTTLLLGEYLD